MEQIGEHRGLEASEHQEHILRTATSSLVELSGVVHHQGPSGELGPETYTLEIPFAAWRVSGAEIRRTPLQLTKLTSNAEFYRLHRLFDPYSIVRMTATIVTDNCDIQSFGLLDEVLGIDIADTDLRAIAVELQTPVTHQDFDFGMLTLDHKLQSFLGATTWNGTQVVLDVSVREIQSPCEGLRTARLLRQDAPQWENRVKDFALANLMQEHILSWSDAGRPPLNSSEFCSRLKLQRISVYAGGRFAYWFDDGDLFFGRSIRVSCDLTSGPNHADLNG